MIIDYHKSSFLDHPIALLRFATGHKDHLHEVILKRTAHILLEKRYDPKLAKKALSEIREGEFVPMNQMPGVNLPGNKPAHLFGKFLYFIIRCAQPKVVVETGVAHGVSSWTILNALHRNGYGKLYSIDLPNQDLKSYNPENIQQTSGWVVPQILRQRWELRLGSSQKLLPELVSELDQLDLFFHDSDHSYENMSFEFNTINPRLEHGGLILSDDVHKNAAFRDFVDNHPYTGIQFFTKGGAAVKESDS